MNSEQQVQHTHTNRPSGAKKKRKKEITHKQQRALLMQMSQYVVYAYYSLTVCISVQFTVSVVAAYVLIVCPDALSFSFNKSTGHY